MKRRKAIGKAIRTQAEAYLADGTISTEPKGEKVTGKNVDNYKTGAITLNPDDGSKPVKQKGIYAHLELKGNSLSESQKKMLEMYDEKKKKEEKKDEIPSIITKDSVKKEDEKKEEKPDMRSKYAMINLIKMKLRAAGQRDPMVMAVDACEEKIDETIIRADGTPTHGAPKRDNAPKGTKKPRQPKEDYSKPLEYGVGPGKALIHYAPNRKNKKGSMKTEERTPAKDDPAFDIMRPGGKNSPYNEDGTKKKKETGPKGGMKKGLRYNPGFDPSKASETTGP